MQQQSKTAIILAGGRGTRLGSLTNTTPKPLLLVTNRPFIFHILDYLITQGIDNVVIATGYLEDQFNKLLGTEYNGISICYSVEHSPLGTGGALAQALLMTKPDHVFVLNGDTLFKADLRELEKTHHRENASLSLVLRYVENTDRYGKIDIRDGFVTELHGKGIIGPGYINGGIYLLKKNQWPSSEEAAYSLEVETLPFLIANANVAYTISDQYFIDIGVPEDLQRSQVELK